MKIDGELRASEARPGAARRLRRRLAEDGYLYFRRALERAPLLRLLDDVLEVLARHGWLDERAPRREARTRAVPVAEGEDDYFPVYDDIQRLESLHRIPHRPELMRIMRQAVGASAFPHPLGIARLAFPDNDEATTPAHQDYPNNQGSEALCAAWLPLHDCPRERGGIAILEGSPRLGLLPLEFSLGAGGRAAVLPAAARGLRWLSADFRAGDVLVFGSLTVHRALPNRSGDRFRLSVDFRYQREGEALTPPVLEPHFGRMRWEEIYAGWESSQHQFYWRRKRFALVPWDDSLHRLPRGHMAEAVRLSRAWRRRRDARRAPPRD